MSNIHVYAPSIPGEYTLMAKIYVSAYYRSKGGTYGPATLIFPFKVVENGRC
jgi:hypothetical protein